MKKTIILTTLAAILLCALPAAAQKPERSPEQHQLWLSEMRKTKHEFLSKELSLSTAQRNDFYAVYDEMDDQLAKINEETRDLERRALSEKNLSDTEYEAISRALFEQKAKESEIELKYYDKFKEILSPRQLVKLKNAERKFTQSLIRHSRPNGREKR